MCSVRRGGLQLESALRIATPTFLGKQATLIGKSLGPYNIIEQLGAGGMGEVYLAEDTRLGRKVAIKVLPGEYASIPERLARFEQEARAAAALNHPHIAVIHDIGFEPDAEGAATGIHYMVQEHLEGQTLRDALGKGALPLKKALDLSTEIGRASCRERV